MTNKFIRTAILLALLLGCTAPDDPSMDETVSDRAQYSVDVRLSLKAATTTSMPTEAELLPFESHEGRIIYTEDGKLFELSALEATSSTARRYLKVLFNPPFSQPGTATAADFYLQATGATGNRFKMILESGIGRITNDVSFCSGVNCRLSKGGFITVRSVTPIEIGFSEVSLVPTMSYTNFSTVILDGAGRWEQTYGAPVTTTPWSGGQPPQ